MTGGREPFLPAPGLPQALGHEWTARPPRDPEGKEGRRDESPPTGPHRRPPSPTRTAPGEARDFTAGTGGTPPLLRGPLS